MKLMSYNIWDGAPDRLSKVVEVVQNESPDYLTVNEANTFSAHNNKILKEFASKTGFPYFDLALSGEMDYHVAVFSKFPLRNVVKLQPLARACLIAEINVPIGLISIASLHLTPFTEDMRHPEIDLILRAQKTAENRILMGDMNSLSPHDNYSDSIIKNFDNVLLTKFTKGGRLRFDAIKKIEESGYYDCAVIKKKSSDPTVPTSIASKSDHGRMRLDYAFVSKPLTDYIDNYSVISNELADTASDHYPIIIELSGD